MAMQIGSFSRRISYKNEGFPASMYLDSSAWILSCRIQKNVHPTVLREGERER